MEFQPLSWPARGRLWFRIFIRVILWVGALLLLLQVGRPAISLCMPFVLALIFTWLLEPLIRTLHRRWHIPRGISSILLVLLLIGAVGGILTGIIWKAYNEISSLSGNWEGVWNTFQSSYYQLYAMAERLFAALPQEAQATVANLSERLLSWLREMGSELLPRTTSFALGLPSVVLAVIFFLVACYFTAADYPNIRRIVTDRIPGNVRKLGTLIKTAFSAAFGGYIRAELLLSVGVFVILMVSFFLMGQNYAVLLAGLLAVLDFIPIIGSGTVLVPWAVVSFALGQPRRGLVLLVVWGCVCLFRRVLEPKFVGNQTGLHPLLSLLSIYVGMKLWGVLGMIFAPVLLLVLINICKAGVFHRTYLDLALAVRDITALLRGAEESGSPK